MKRYLLIETQKLWEVYIPAFQLTLPLDVVQPLGLVQIAAVIREREPDAEVLVYDLRLLKNDFSGVASYVRECNPDVIGFRIVSRDSLFANDIIRTVKEAAPGAVMIAGGPHVTSFKERVLDESPLDFAVYGEGELTLPDLLDHIESGGGYEEVPGLIYRDKDGRPRINEPRPYIEDLDSIPMPAWDLVEHQKYFDMMYYPNTPTYFNARYEVVSIFTSRACPYRCTFCHNIFGKKFRAQSPEKVLAEIEHLYHKYGVRQFDFRDDIFNLDKKRVHRICDLIIEKKLDLNMTFPNGLRGDIMDEELVLKMKAAGMFRCTYALETASPRIQKMIHKNIDLDRLREIIRFTSAQDIIIRIFVMLGFPTETREELRQTLDYGMDPAIDYLILNTVNPFEGTEMAKALREEGLDLDEFRDKLDYLSARMSVCEVSAEELQAIKNDARDRFFSEERLANAVRKLKLYFRSTRPAPVLPVYSRCSS